MEILSKTVHLDDPFLGRLEKVYLARCIDSTYVSTYGPFVPAFENRLAEYLRCPQAVSLQSGTAGLYMALHELGLGPGDEVIVPSLTFVATANAVKYVGATPVFLTLSPGHGRWIPSMSRCITPRTKALIPVHLYGNPCAMERIGQIARRHGLSIVEDATESLGSTYGDQFTGTIGDFGVFSFNGNKLITTGGGGMIVGPDKKHMDHIKLLVNQAREEGDGYYHQEIGFNYRMTNLEAALGLAQMERIEVFIKRKRKFRDIYSEAFHHGECLQLQEPQPGSNVMWWLNSVRIDTQAVGQSIPEIQTKLKDKGIPSRRIFMPVNELPPYEKEGKNPCPVARQLFEHGLSLPSSPVNDEKCIRYAAEQLTSLLRTRRMSQPSVTKNISMGGLPLSS